MCILVQTDYPIPNNSSLTIEIFIFGLSRFQTSIIITPGLVNSVVVSLNFYPATPNFEPPAFDNLHLDLLRPRL